MHVIHTGQLKHVEFTLAVGDLFDARVQAIVNSEQTDFMLSYDLNSVSGQIRRRYGISYSASWTTLRNGTCAFGARAGIRVQSNRGLELGSIRNERAFTRDQPIGHS